MRFIDANVIIYAVLKPKSSLPAAVVKKKNAAKQIFLRVNDGEPVQTSTVHLSEIANVLEDAAGYRFAADLIGALLSKPTIDVVTVSAEDYLRSVHSALKFEISLNDALALTIMEDRGIDEIYTFDSHFGRTPVKVIQA